ncbi:MAG: NPCBM/NEW2 domain-containing protein [Armatimonadetes bacterium]|nr:NPCBM/NEW2 domain-containing protein [Armatimonadota bacterium]
MRFVMDALSMTVAFLALSQTVLEVMAAERSGGASNWNSPDRGAKVASLIPGRKIPKFTPENLFADWTKQQVERWNKEHPPLPPEEADQKYAATAPTDADLTGEFPIHISPFGRLRGGQADNSPEHHVVERADQVMVSYCPFCGSQSFSLAFDPKNPYGHVTTNCCRTDLYATAKDWPAPYPHKPNTSVKFLHLDDTWVEVPCTVYRDKEGVEWELFINTIFDHKRWLEQGCELVKQFSEKFKETADPLYAHKIAVLLDMVADTYYGLPLAANNKLCNGKDGKPLTRTEWEAVPRPAIFEVSYLGAWSKREPYSSPGWLNMMGEHVWVEPFARVRNHPSFKFYSQKKYGDPEALDRKVITKLLRELSLMFQSVFSQKLLHNYQEAIYIDLWLLGVLTQDKVLIDFAAPCQELSMYNHTYQDGMNGEGAPNYMDMPGGYYYPILKDPKGWLQYDPQFLERNPFYEAASTEMHKTATVRGMELEFGDQHQHAWLHNFLTDLSAVRANERIGSRNWAGYGVGLLRVGGPGHRMEAGLDYTRATLHNAQDALSMECWVDGVPVMRKGGYSAWWSNAHLQWDRPEYQALKNMGYPREIAEGGWAFDAWSWVWSHSPHCQNTLTVDEVGTGKGWGDNRGYGEVITFKGGEAAGAPGSGFQVLDVRDHYSWSRVGKQVSDWRRTVIGVEGPYGRPYMLELVKIKGGARHALYNNGWADRVEATLPPVKSRAENLAQVFFGDKLPEDTTDYRNYRNLRKVEEHAPAGPTYDLTWKTDMAAYSPRDLNGKPFQRPLPEDVGRVRLRFIGVNKSPGETRLLSGKGPWIGFMRQPLPNNQRVDGNVAFMDARDYLIEYRTGGTDDKPLESLFAHVLEGYREGEQSCIKSVTPLKVTSVKGPERDVLALRLKIAGDTLAPNSSGVLGSIGTISPIHPTTAGHTDTVIYQSEAGTVKLPDGLETDARYALLRRDAKGEVIEADLCRGTYIIAGKFRASMPGDLTGTIVDVIGDLTGTRQESALIIKPDKPWPAGDNLKNRQLLLRVESALRDPCNEGYRVENATALSGGLVRVDLQDHAPFVISWHEVAVLPADKPNVIRTNRPMVDHGNNPWYCGMKLWFPERGKTYTIKKVNEVGGGYGGDTVELVENVNLAAEGVKVGDWYVIYGVQPGLKVTIPNDFCWRREPASGWQQYGLRATGTVSVKSPITSGALSYRMGTGKWQEAATGRDTFAGDEAGEQGVSLIAAKPAWLKLNDATTPSVTRLTLDGQEMTAEAAKDLGWIEPPRHLSVEIRDAENPLDPASFSVTLNRKRLGKEIVTFTTTEKEKGIKVEVNLEKALVEEQSRPRKHIVEVAVADRSADHRVTSVVVSFINKVPLETEVTYLSDLKALRSFAHAGLILDKNYYGGVAEVSGRLYPKCVMICPEPSPDGAHGEVLYALPADKGPLTLHAEVGIEEIARAYGSVVFMVQTGDSPDGPWETLYTSPTLRGGQEPMTIAVPLGKARYLRLYTTDADDGIGSDHATWGNARVK